MTLAIGGGVLALVLALAMFGVGRRAPAPEAVTLEFWGFEDREETWGNVIAEFQKENENFIINYIRFPEATYEETLINRLAEGRGPDIFLLSNRSVFKHKDKIFPVPQEFGISPKDFGRTFVDIASQDLVDAKGKILGVPLFVDSLALVYNKDILNAAGVANPPKNWDEVALLAGQLTKLNPAKDIIISGVSMGTAANIERYFEILSSLILQEGEKIVEDEDERKVISLGQGAERALGFYTSFADPNSRRFSWTTRLKDSFTSFSEGSTAFVFANASDLALIQSKNPHLSLGVTALPQPKDSRNAITYGSYFFPTVSKFSANPVAAWQFILGIAYGEEAKTYLEQTGRAPARRDLIQTGTKSTALDVYYRQALSAKNWPVPDEQKIKNIFKEAIEQTAAKTISADQAINRLGQQLRLLLP